VKIFEEEGPPALFMSQRPYYLAQRCTRRNPMTGQRVDPYYYFTPDLKTIQFLDTASSRVSTLANLGKPAGGSICISPDGAYVLRSQTDQNTEDLMLVENFR
jgi:hypothetical protein